MITQKKKKSYQKRRKSQEMVSHRLLKSLCVMPLKTQLTTPCRKSSFRKENYIKKKKKKNRTDCLRSNSEHTHAHTHTVRKNAFNLTIQDKIQIFKECPSQNTEQTMIDTYLSSGLTRTCARDL